MITRARPLLGTFVAVQADGPPGALDEAFAAIETVHTHMSFHSPESDLSRINRAGHRAPVHVHPWTYKVLAMACELGLRTQGAFDVTLPEAPGSYADLVLYADGTVGLRRPAQIDLGGIAKGFAVDAAVQALERAGASRGCVNAGGDLRRFGEPHPPVHVRVPGIPDCSVRLPDVPRPAFATSSSCFGSRLHDPRSRRRKRFAASITVAAATCVIADALTKVVALLGPHAAVLRDFDALAFAVDRDGRTYAPAV